MKILSFSEFSIVNEGWLYQEFEGQLRDFGFERDFAKFLGEYEDEWARLKKDYNWNRYSIKNIGGHFAIDAKVYAYPDLNLINSELGLSLGEEELDMYWWRFMENMRDEFTEDIDEQYGWIKSIRWGGKSGGWMLIIPEYDDEDFEDEVNYWLYGYTLSKDKVGEEEVLNISKEESDPNYHKLIQIGLAEPSSHFKELKRDIGDMIQQMQIYLAKIRRMRSDLEEIAQIPKKFEKNAVDNFKGWLKDNIE
jgi:hypothetical protein